MSISTAVTPPDFSGVTDAITAFAPPLVAALVLTIGAGLAVMAIKWGSPQIVQFFKKISK